jgi:hypothetical protein
MSNKQSTYLAVLATVTGLLSVFSTSKPLLAQSLPSGTDQGYGHLPRAFVDANGDGRVDYCRFVGDAPNVFIACVLGTPEGFDVANQFTFRSIGGIDQGYGDRLREFRDANGDGKSDYCRFVGDSPNIYEACNLATSVGFDANQYSYLTGKKDSEASNTLAPETSGIVKGDNNKKSMGGGYAEAEATFYRNGLTVIATHSVSNSWAQGTKGSVFVVGSDSKGRALFASPVLDIPTACSKPDPCSSNRRDTVQYQVNSELAKYVAKIDVYVQDRGTTSLRQSINRTITQTCGTYDDLPPAAKAGIAYETGFAGCGPR